MKSLTRSLIVLSALLVLTSCSTFKNSQLKQDNSTEFCPSSAFINEKEYELADLTSTSDKEFHQWAADGLTKYPQLKMAYGLLRECWDYYHPKE